MKHKSDTPSAVVVLPPVHGGRLSDPGLRRWLAHGRVSRYSKREPLLATLLGVLGRQPPATGIAALRMWGQTGDRPTVWIAAADPVYLEPRLDHLCLHAFGADGVPAAELNVLVDHLQAALGNDADIGFARVGTCCYLRPDRPLETSDSPPAVIDQDMPNRYMPSAASAARYRKLVSEIEMALHDHPVNLDREMRGLKPVNSLWLWGGGFAPEQLTQPLLPLFAGDPLLSGYWMSVTGVSEPWPGSIDACLEASVAGFVAVAPDVDDPDGLASWLAELRSAMLSRRLERLEILFRDGIRAQLRRSDLVRFWRRRSLLDEAP